jgi:hypothetical protein
MVCFPTALDADRMRPGTTDPTFFAQLAVVVNMNGGGAEE